MKRIGTLLKGAQLVVVSKIRTYTNNLEKFMCDMEDMHESLGKGVFYFFDVRTSERAKVLEVFKNTNNSYSSTRKYYKNDFTQIRRDCQGIAHKIRDIYKIMKDRNEMGVKVDHYRKKVAKMQIQSTKESSTPKLKEKLSRNEDKLETSIQTLKLKEGEARRELTGFLENSHIDAARLIATSLMIPRNYMKTIGNEKWMECDLGNVQHGNFAELDIKMLENNPDMKKLMDAEQNFDADEFDKDLDSIIEQEVFTSGDFGRGDSNNSRGPSVFGWIRKKSTVVQANNKNVANRKNTTRSMSGRSGSGRSFMGRRKKKSGMDDDFDFEDIIENDFGDNRDSPFQNNNSSGRRDPYFIDPPNGKMLEKCDSGVRMIENGSSDWNNSSSGSGHKKSMNSNGRNNNDPINRGCSRSYASRGPMSSSDFHRRDGSNQNNSGGPRRNYSDDKLAQDRNNDDGFDSDNINGRNSGRNDRDGRVNYGDDRDSRGNSGNEQGGRRNFENERDGRRNFGNDDDDKSFGLSEITSITSNDNDRCGNGRQNDRNNNNDHQGSNGTNNNYGNNQSNSDSSPVGPKGNSNNQHSFDDSDSTDIPLSDSSVSNTNSGIVGEEGSAGRQHEDKDQQEIVKSDKNGTQLRVGQKTGGVKKRVAMIQAMLESESGGVKKVQQIEAGIIEVGAPETGGDDESPQKRHTPFT